MGPMLWQGGWHVSGGHVPAAPHAVQLSANVPGRAAEATHSGG